MFDHFDLRADRAYGHHTAIGCFRGRKLDGDERNRLAIEQGTATGMGLGAVLETLNAHYTFDSSGRIIGGSDGGVLPRFVLGRAVEGCVWRFRFDLPQELVASLSRLASREPGANVDGESTAPPERWAMLERLLSPPGSRPLRGRPPSVRIPVTRGCVTVGEIWRID